MNDIARIWTGYEYYQARLIADGGGAPIEGAHPYFPQPGRWRTQAPASNPSGNVTQRPPRSRAVAIWIETDGLTNAQFDDDYDNRLIEGTSERWHDFVGGTWLRLKPVTEAGYQKYFDEGMVWPDEHPAVTQSNNAPPDDTVEAIDERIKDLTREAEKIISGGEALTKDQADRASDLKNAIALLGKRADELRVEKKKPHLEAERKVDAEWFPLVRSAAAVVERLRAIVIGPFQVKYEAKQKAAIAAQVAAGAPPETVTPLRTVMGTRGRGTTLRTVKVVTINDQDAVYGFFKNSVQVKELLQQLAQGAAKNGVEVPGITVTEERKAV